ncbi:MAG: hypothetical protein AMXMBFR46_03960 [Acidimicrobiia bacterium]
MIGVDLGDFVAGIRVDDAATLDGLRRALAAHAVEGVDAHPNVSISVGQRDGRLRGMHHVYRRGSEVLTTPSLGRAVRAALHHLAGLVGPPPGLVALNGELLVAARPAHPEADPAGGPDTRPAHPEADPAAGPDADPAHPARPGLGREAVVVYPGWILSNLSERRLVRVGWRRADGLVPWLDPADPSGPVVVVPEMPLVLDDEARRILDDELPVAAADRPIDAGRYRLRAVVLFGAEPEGSPPLTPARRLVAASGLVATPEGPARARGLGMLADVLARTEVRASRGAGIDEILRILPDAGTG